MKRSTLILAALLGISSCALALDFHATPESVWRRHVQAPMPTKLSEHALRTALEWQNLKGPLPKISTASPFGIQLQYWNRVINHMGLPAVADDYCIFLGQLRAELTKESTNQAQQHPK